jgi:hypothetical protein
MQHRHLVILLMALESHGIELSIVVSAGFQPNTTQQDYPLDCAPQHAMKIKKSQSLHSHDQTCPVDDGAVDGLNKGQRTCSTDI